MIELTRLSGEESSILINSRNIIEVSEGRKSASGEKKTSVIEMSNGRKILVEESKAEIANLISEWEAKVASYHFDGSE